MEDGENQRVLDASERFADTTINATELAVVRNVTASWFSYVAAPHALQAALKTASWASEEEGWKTLMEALGGMLGAGYCPKPYRNAGWMAERKAQADILRDIFGTPFPPVPLDRSWLIPTVKGLAQSIYDNRSFDEMPLLADDLVKAGCANQEILGHCRGQGPHVRGCWVVDMVLGKV